MATYRVTDPATGKTVKITGDSPPTESELNDIFSAVHPPEKEPSIIGKAWNALTIPEKVVANTIPKLTALQGNIQNTIAAKTGLPIQEEPTGNLLRDVAAGTPRIIGEIGEKIVPPMVSRGSLLTMGALKGAQMAAPALKMIGGGLASQLESASGTTPGALKEAFNNPKLIFSAGAKAAQPLYEAGKEIGGEMNGELSQIPKKIEFVKKAADLADAGQLNPTSALEARKELDGIKKQVTNSFFRDTRNKLDEIAKVAFAEADPAYKQGKMADSIRNILPQNKYGGASAFKMGIGPALTALGGSVGNAIGLPAEGAAAGAALAAGTLSPIVQGAAATGAGMAARAVSPLISNPAIAGPALATVAKNLTPTKIKEYLKAFKNDKAKARAAAIRDGYNPDLPISE